MLQGQKLHEAINKYNEYKQLISCVDKLKAPITSQKILVHILGAALKMDKHVITCVLEAQKEILKQELNEIGVNPE